VLDRYVDALHEADAQSRTQLLTGHPELRGLLACLDSLEILAPEDDDAAEEPPTGADAPTLIDAAHTPRDLAAENAPRSDSSVIPDAFVDGQEFGKYTLLREIGRGGMGVVYLARQSDLDRMVAVKMILSSRLASQDDVRRFLAESKAAGRLRHANIVGIHEAGQIHGQHYFVMDHVDGCGLNEWARQADVTLEAKVECIVSVARAVDYLHEQGIVHRDLKPSNILVDGTGTPFVTDFGLARVFTADSRETRTGTIIGTPSYMPPEQAAGRMAEIGPRSDVYSLGAILYELLTGRPPFQRENPLDVLVDVLEGEPEQPSKVNPAVPRELELVCLKCLEKAPEKRYDSAKELADDLERYLKREPVSARPTGIVQRLRRWARRQPALVSRLGGLLAAFLIVQTRHMYNLWTASEDFDTAYYLRIISVLGTWAVVSFGFQTLLERERTANIARFGWAAADCILLTTALCLAEPPLGPLLIGFPLLVAASGLFFRVRLVLFTTGVSVAAFAVLMAMRPGEADPPHYPVIFGATLAVIGFVVAHQVYRVRALSRYYERRNVP